MTVSQMINHINDNSYDDDITITDIPQGNFPAVTNITLGDGGITREITVEIMMLEQSPGGTMNANTGLFIRKPDETGIKVTVKKDGQTLAENTTAY